MMSQAIDAAALFGGRTHLREKKNIEFFCLGSLTSHALPLFRSLPQTAAPVIKQTAACAKFLKSLKEKKNQQHNP